MRTKPFSCTFTNDFYQFREQIVERIAKPRLWFPQGNLYYYPDIGDWSQKVYQELSNGSKRAFIAIINQQIIGVIIYQRHKVEFDVLEVKHLSVDDFFAGRKIASFLFRQAEIEGIREFQPKLIRCDVKAALVEVRQFLQVNQYQLVTSIDLYRLKTGLDAVYQKEVKSIWRRTLSEQKIIIP